MMEKYLVVCDECSYKGSFGGDLRGFSDAQASAVRHAGRMNHTVKFYSGLLEGIVEPSQPGQAFIVAVRPRAV